LDRADVGAFLDVLLRIRGGAAERPDADGADLSDGGGACDECYASGWVWDGDVRISQGAELFGNFTYQADSTLAEERNGFLALAEFDEAAGGRNGGFGGNDDGAPWEAPMAPFLSSPSV
jgi:hypothetical protein